MTSMLCSFPTLFSTSVKADRPIRIICVGGAITEIIYELGLEKHLVAVDSSSNFPSSVKILPNVGYARMLSIEGILSMKPSHILFSDNAGPQHVVDFFRSNKNIFFDQFKSNHNFDGLLNKVKRISDLFDVVKKGELLQRRLSFEWAQLHSITNNKKIQKHPPRILFILSHRSSEILVGGKDTEADAMIQYAGGINVASDIQGYKPFSREVLIQSNPEIILITEQSKKYLHSLLSNHSLNAVSAIKNQRVIAIDANQLLGFGPRLPMTIAQLRKDFFV
jgi:iron complex transport system substrate-binding protein